MSNQFSMPEAAPSPVLVLGLGLSCFSFPTSLRWLLSRASQEHWATVCQRVLLPHTPAQTGIYAVPSMQALARRSACQETARPVPLRACSHSLPRRVLPFPLLQLLRLART